MPELVKSLPHSFKPFSVNEMVSIDAYLAVTRNKHHPFMRRKHNYTIQRNHAPQAFSILPNERSLIITTSTCESLLILHGNAGVALVAGIEDCGIVTGPQEYPAENKAAALGV
ncbi:hypothetical protein HGM15179_010603 [Zosterops borbonicus]|uniref:Uncharacterized protein n=1 Tax=Zosterops borbonicus TaxID=364589 RepID=A0A8K1LJL0_9PASS|nr:hypothetical protein HGM15179_010603 [Zosterops borbonicus]